jgi:hypothetical protein
MLVPEERVGRDPAAQRYRHARLAHVQCSTRFREAMTRSRERPQKHNSARQTKRSFVGGSAAGRDFSLQNNIRYSSINYISYIFLPIFFYYFNRKKIKEVRSIKKITKLYSLNSLAQKLKIHDVFLQKSPVSGSFCLFSRYSLTGFASQIITDHPPISLADYTIVSTSGTLRRRIRWL